MRKLVLSHQPTCMGSVSIAPVEPWAVVAPVELSSCKKSAQGLPSPITGHPTLPQCLQATGIPFASGINAFNSCLSSGLQISVAFSSLNGLYFML